MIIPVLAVEQAPADELIDVSVADLDLINRKTALFLARQRAVRSAPVRCRPAPGCDMTSLSRLVSSDTSPLLLSTRPALYHICNGIVIATNSEAEARRSIVKNFGKTLMA
jgi:hypothetical protein